MIYVYFLPQTIWEKINYQFGRSRFIICDEIRYGAGVVECVFKKTDRCRTFRMDQIAEIFWDSGYSQAVAEVKAEHEERLQKGMAAAIGLSPITPEIEGNGDETVPNHINPYS